MNNEALEALERLMNQILGIENNYGQGKRGLSSDIKIIEQALTPEVDLDATKAQAVMECPIKLCVAKNDEESNATQIIEWTIDHLSKRGLLRGDVAGMVLIKKEPTKMLHHEVDKLGNAYPHHGLYGFDYDDFASAYRAIIAANIQSNS